MPSSARAVAPYRFVSASMGGIVLSWTGVRVLSFSRSLGLELTLGRLRLDPLLWLEFDYFFDEEFYLLAPFR
jgi:hypothetical protein